MAEIYDPGGIRARATVPQESNVFEPEVNSDFIDKSDPGPSKLENSL